jgi:PAS domain S-box-containing protein
MRRKAGREPTTIPDGLGPNIGPAVRAVVRDLPVPAAVLDLDGHAWTWNEAAEMLFPPPPQTPAATYPLFSLGSQPWFDQVRHAALGGRGSGDLQWRLRGVGGTRYRLGMDITPLRDEDGAIVAMLALLQDTTARDRAFSRTRRNARWYCAVLDHLADPVVVHRAGRILFANRATLRLLGLTGRRQIVGRELDEWVTPASGARASDLLVASYAVLHLPDDRTCEGELVPATTTFHNRKAITITLRHIAPMLKGPASATPSRKFTDGFSGHGVILLDEVGHVTSWNAGAETITGYRAEEIIGRDLSLIYTAEDGATDEPSRPLREAVARGRYREEGWKQRKDGSRFWCQMVATVLYDGERRIEGFAVMLTDLTRQRAGEEAARHTDDQLRQAQRMEAIGRLAGGIAHDFNNLLTAIQGHVQFLIDDLPGQSASREDAVEIQKAADRAAALTRQLLTFSRRQELQTRVINLNEIIAEMGNLFRRVINEDIQLQTNFEPQLWPVRADSGQIEQVLMNLVVNARDAMPRGGTITIRTANVELDDTYADLKLNVGAGPYVLLSVSDTGIGMDRETQSHVFEPFFTTKEHGKGTGLGLATVYGIVKQSSGHVWVYSEPNHGTTFKIYLPRVAESGEVLQRAPKFGNTARDGETILLIEDEPAVRSLARRVLESRGYAVLEAGCGREAIQIASDRDGPIHLMLSDVVIPDMNGAVIAQQLHQSRPDLKTLFMSGYTDEDVKLQGIMETGAPFIEKPFTPDLLARKVREVLDMPD